MAAYGALVSVMHTIDQIEHHPRPPISLDKAQVESLTQKITFLQEFLEDYSQVAGYSKDADPLEMRIADAAYAAEDVIESHIVDQILPRSTTRNFFKCFRSPRKAAADHEDEAGSTDHLFYRSLQRVIEEMDSLNKEVMEIKEKTGVRDPMLRNSMSAGSTGQNVTMVGFDDILVEFLDKLTGGQHDRQIIPIVGMGGTGKTTLARNIYENQVVMQHFDFRAWVTISQVYRLREILLQLVQEDGSDMSKKNEYELRDELHKQLTGRRYIIIMDDIWDIQVWDQLKRFFPDNENGSRIVITTRISNFELTDSYVLTMGFLDKDKSWALFSKIVFGEKGCPFNLEKIGKKIVENCRGLPLSIVVVGGLLAKSKQTQEYWGFIQENLNLIVNSEDDEKYLKILHISYNQLPVYLKPCFLYMGVFPEDSNIRVSELIELWVREGFLKPISGRSLEDVANEYLKELINRNLVLAHELGSIGNIKYCKIHDLLRDLCLRQAEKEKFYNVIKQRSHNTPLDTIRQRCVVIPEKTSQNKVLSALQIMSPARSLTCYSVAVPPLHNFRFLRIMSCPHYEHMDFKEDMFKSVNLRCLVFEAFSGSILPSSFYLLWNLQTIIVGKWNAAPFDIWNMPQLKHLKFAQRFTLPNPPSRNDSVVLGNLETLGSIMNFKFCEEVVRRIPNIKKLKVEYIQWWKPEEVPPDYCVNNLDLLHKLESFYCRHSAPGGVDYLQNLTFPRSLKKLTLSIVQIHWENKMEKIGALPVLEKLVLRHGYFKGRKWETVEGQFPNLKFLSVEWCIGLEYWTTESSHFPRLERLVLEGLEALKEVPSEIVEIPTLQSIMLHWCSNSIVISAKKVVDEQEELYGNVGLQVRVRTSDFGQKAQLRNLATPNFQFL